MGVAEGGVAGELGLGGRGQPVALADEVDVAARRAAAFGEGPDEQHTSTLPRTAGQGVGFAGEVTAQRRVATAGDGEWPPRLP